MTKYKWLDNLIFVVALVAAFVLLWVVAALAVDNTLVLPMPSGVWKELRGLLSSSDFYVQVGITVARSLIAFVLSVVVALLLALAAHLFRIKRVLNAVVTLLRALPTMSIIFLCIVLFPSRVISVIVTFLVVFPVMYAAFDSALTELKPLDDMCCIFGVNRLSKVRFVYLPYLPKHTFMQCRSTVALAVKVCIAGEALALPRHGIGVEMYVAKVNLDTAALLAWTIAALVCCYLIDGLFSVVGKVTLDVAARRDITASGSDAGNRDAASTQKDGFVVDELQTKNAIVKVVETDNRSQSGTVDVCDVTTCKDNVGVEHVQNQGDLVLKNIGVKFGDNVLYNDLNMTFACGKVHVILGASGCGKTTLLNVVAGLVSHTGIVSGANKCSYVFQDARLCTGISVSDNIRLVLRGNIADEEERNLKVNEMLTLAELSDKAQRRVDTLSGGEAQRVSLARAFAYDSNILLADEPMKSLDLAVRRKLYDTLDEMLRARPITVLYVTHDVEEAAMLADEVYIASGRPCSITHVATVSKARKARDPWSEEETVLRKQLEKLISAV